MKFRRLPRFDRRRGAGIVRAERRQCPHYRRATARKHRRMADRRTLPLARSGIAGDATGFSPVAPRPVAGSVFLRKPFPSEDIIRAVRNVGKERSS